MDTKIKRIIFIILLFIFWQQAAGVYIEPLPFDKVVPYLGEFFYKSKIAKTTGDNCICYQSENYGGFPKNILVQQKITTYMREYIDKKSWGQGYCTIDNGATTSEIIYLANLYKYTSLTKYKEAAENGIWFLLNMQYDNGGFPQCMPPKQSYQAQITFNDNADISVLKILREIARKNPPFDFVNNEMALIAQKEFDKGVQLILKTQIVQNGRKTGWCAQYDRKTLKPCQGRRYEHPSISGGRETVGILLFLMSIEKPSDEIKDAIISGINWLESSKITKLRREYYVNNEGLKDLRMISCDDCPPIWARCYEISTNRPIFSGKRDNRIKYDINEITQTKRVSYEWYSSEGLDAIREYNKWKERENIK